MHPPFLEGNPLTLNLFYCRAEELEQVAVRLAFERQVIICGWILDSSGLDKAWY